MRNVGEIKFDYKEIEKQISELGKLRDKAVTCSTKTLSMPLSKGDAKDALIDAQEAMASFAGTVAIMLKDIINDLNYAKTKMKQIDDGIAQKIK